MALKYGAKIKRIYWLINVIIACPSCEVVSAAGYHMRSAVHSPGGGVFSHTSLEMGTSVPREAFEVQVAKR